MIDLLAEMAEAGRRLQLETGGPEDVGVSCRVVCRADGTTETWYTAWRDFPLGDVFGSGATLAEAVTRMREKANGARARTVARFKADAAAMGLAVVESSP